MPNFVPVLAFANNQKKFASLSVFILSKMEGFQTVLDYEDLLHPTRRGDGGFSHGSAWQPFNIWLSRMTIACESKTFLPKVSGEKELRTFTFSRVSAIHLKTALHHEERGETSSMVTQLEFYFWHLDQASHCLSSYLFFDTVLMDFFARNCCNNLHL